MYKYVYIYIYMYIYIYTKCVSCRGSANKVRLGRLPRPTSHVGLRGVPTPVEKKLARQISCELRPLGVSVHHLAVRAVPLEASALRGPDQPRTEGAVTPLPCPRTA